MAYLNAIGLSDATEYNLNPTDFTHLNAAGSVVFGNMVSVLLNGESSADFAQWTVPDATIAQDIANGIFVLPSV